MKKDLKIAISGKSGSGNSTVSGLLASTLGLELINYTFRNMARELGMDLKELRARAEADFSWDRRLDEKQIEMAKDKACVLGSRLAMWILRDADLRVYLDAPIDVRAKRIHKREGGDYDAILAETIERDRRDSERYFAIYGIDNDVYDFADLVIDTGKKTPEPIVEEILELLRKKSLL